MEPGDLVMSEKGIADGDLRKTDRPKKKKIKHVVQTGFDSEFIKKRFAESQKVTNTELRNEISKFKDSLNPSAFPME